MYKEKKKHLFTNKWLQFDSFIFIVMSTTDREQYKKGGKVKIIIYMYMRKISANSLTHSIYWIISIYSILFSKTSFFKNSFESSVASF